MSISLSDQLLSLFYYFICGAALGLIFDLLKIFILVFGGKKIFVFVCDVLFMLIAAFASVFLSMGFARGSTRYFAVISELFGFLCFRFTLGRFFVRVFEWFWLRFRKIFKIVTDFILKIMKKVLKPEHNILYNKTKKVEETSNS